MEHWNIQLSIQRVTETPETDAVKRFAQGKPPIVKSVLQVADIKVQAETEAEAFAKVRRLLDASQTPQTKGVAQHRQGAAYNDAVDAGLLRPIRDNPQA